jgi:hypothetical protein
MGQRIKESSKRFSDTERIISNYIGGFLEDSKEALAKGGTYYYRSYTKAVKLMNIFPTVLIEKMRENLYASNEISKFLLNGEVTGIFSTYALLKTYKYEYTRLSEWKQRGYYLNEYELRTLQEMNILHVDLKWGLDNIKINN